MFTLCVAQVKYYYCCYLLIYFIFEGCISYQIQSKLNVLDMFPKFRTFTVFVTFNLKDSFDMVAMYFYKPKLSQQTRCASFWDPLQNHKTRALAPLSPLKFALPPQWQSWETEVMVIMGNIRIRRWGSLQYQSFRTTFHKKRWGGPKFEIGNTSKYMVIKFKLQKKKWGKNVQNLHID